MEIGIAHEWLLPPSTGHKKNPDNCATIATISSITCKCKKNKNVYSKNLTHNEFVWNNILLKTKAFLLDDVTAVQEHQEQSKRSWLTLYL